MITHESYIARVAELAISRLDKPEDREALRAIKLTYGAGPDGVRGITYYRRWKGTGAPGFDTPGQDAAVPFVALNAMCQESPLQLAGTTVHELGHVLAGWEAGHGKPWHEACGMLGLRRIKAAGTVYRWAMFDPWLRQAIAKLPNPTDGQPVCSLSPNGIEFPNGAGGMLTRIKPCGAGKGTKGGKSFGAGSGSRLLKFQCDGIGHKPTIVRASAGADFNATCNHCQTLFRLA